MSSQAVIGYGESDYIPIEVTTLAAERDPSGRKLGNKCSDRPSSPPELSVRRGRWRRRSVSTRRVRRGIRVVPATVARLGQRAVSSPGAT